MRQMEEQTSDPGKWTCGGICQDYDINTQAKSRNSPKFPATVHKRRRILATSRPPPPRLTDEGILVNTHISGVGSPPPRRYGALSEPARKTG
jgi:hypothetical protein